MISSRRSTVLAEATARLAALGSVGFEPGDASVVVDVERVTNKAVAFMGGLDTIVVSAGAGGRTPILETNPDEFQRIIDNTLRPLFLAVRIAGTHLLAAGRGSVIVISSMYGLVGQKERVAYCGAKAGVNGMVRSMALDLADKGIRVNAICPGFVETPLAVEVANLEPDPSAALSAKRLLHPVPRPGRLEEMGELAVYLASDLAAFVTGQSIAIDGGYSAR
jgi:NAD(P)-dependent dehydrogenase (short-subunit alcohol dehydrogenase family)